MGISYTWKMSNDVFTENWAEGLEERWYAQFIDRSLLLVTFCERNYRSPPHGSASMSIHEVERWRATNIWHFITLCVCVILFVWVPPKMWQFVYYCFSHQIWWMLRYCQPRLLYNYKPHPFLSWHEINSSQLCEVRGSLYKTLATLFLFSLSIST